MTKPHWHQRLYWRGAVSFLVIFAAWEVVAWVFVRSLDFSDPERAMRRALGLATVGALAAVVTHTIVARSYLRRRMEASRRMLMGAVTEVELNVPPDELTFLASEVAEVVDGMRESLVRLKKERRQLRTLLEGMGEGVLMLDDAERVLVANSVAAKQLGLKKKHIGQRLTDVCDAPRLQALVAEALWSQEPASGDFDVTRRSDNRHLAANATPILSGETSMGAVVVLRDVTMLRRLENVRRDFVANVSHELRTPIAAVSSAAETLLLTDAELDPPLPQFLETIERNAGRMAAIVEDLLLLSRLEAAGYEIQLQEVELASVVADVLDRCQPLADDAGVELNFEVEPELAAVFAERVGLSQILQNLVENAVKYTPRDGCVRLSAKRKSNKWVLVEVTDTGPGIAEEHLDRIFERFYRVDPGRSRDVGGTGLGLAIVKHHVRRLKGKIGVQSEPEHGTTFSLLLRVYRPEKAA